jgi:hypothetical protein
MSMDRFMYAGGALVAMSYRYSELRPGGVGTEIGIALFPEALPAGVLAIAPDLGAAYNFTVPGGSVLIKAGGSAMAALGAGGIGFVPGLHVGGAFLLKTGDRSGARVDVIRHYYWSGGEEMVSTWSIGLGFAILPRGS